MPGRTIAEQPFSGDDGAAAPAVAATLAAYAAGRAGEHAALTALAGTRLLVPVVAVLAEAEEAPAAGGSALRRDKTSEMALPTLVGNDGRHAVLAFTGLDALTRWRPDARPVPVPAGRVWEAGAREADAVVIDVAGPVPLAVEGARLAAMACGRPVPRPHEDPDLIALAQAAAADEPAVAGISLLPGPEGTDLAVGLRAPTAAAALEARAAAQRIASAIMAGSGGRLRRGIAVSLVEG